MYGYYGEKFHVSYFLELESYTSFKAELGQPV